MKRFRPFALALSLLLFAPFAVCQPPGPPPFGPDGRPPQMDHGPGGPGMGMGIMPPGTWWRRPEIIQTLSLSSEQQKNLDSIFLQSRTQLVQMHATLEEQQLQLEPLLAANPVDDARVMTIVAKIADTRAELEKANAKMLLSLRKVLTSDQWTKLQAMRPEHRWGGGQEFKRRGGPDGPGGPPTPPAPTGGEGGEQ